MYRGYIIHDNKKEKSFTCKFLLDITVQDDLCLKTKNATYIPHLKMYSFHIKKRPPHTPKIEFYKFNSVLIFENNIVVW